MLLLCETSKLSFLLPKKLPPAATMLHNISIIMLMVLTPAAFQLLAASAITSSSVLSRQLLHFPGVCTIT